MHTSEDARDPAEGDTCTEVQARIPLYIGDDLDAPAMSRVEEHLARCEACGGQANEARRARAALRRLAGEGRGQGRDLWGGVRTLLHQEGLLPDADAVEHAENCVGEQALQRPRPQHPLEIPEIHPKFDPEPAPDSPPSSPSQPLPPIVTRERPAAEQARRDVHASPVTDDPLLAPGEGAPDRLPIDMPVIEEKVYRAQRRTPPTAD